MVIRRISDLNYEIKRLNAVKSEIMHVAALKPYHRRTENFVQQEEAEDIVQKKQYSLKRAAKRRSKTQRSRRSYFKNLTASCKTTA